MFPPFHGVREGIRSWRSREPTGELKDIQRRKTEEEDPEDTWTPLQEKRGQSRYGTVGQGERSGRREEKGKTTGTAPRARGKEGERGAAQSALVRGGPAVGVGLFGLLVEPGAHVVGVGCRAGSAAPVEQREEQTADPGPSGGSDGRG
ncbi:hypothetical protein NDU88_002166 [Pleurodeles waltl]|uniref:Uncharacterized protein n=1 Tax=Pleurodeles waltl TaxID=8319 RepID=A0AAV7M3A4_PLEWA|nr:hypothetical protein NDU88_002166 [Pleurodeles waltl]